MGHKQVRVATPNDREAVLSSLVAAFPKDPVLRYLFPSDAEYRQYAPVFFGRLFDKRVGRKTVWTVDGSAVAMWDAPDASDQAPSDEIFPANVRGQIAAYDAAVHAVLPDPPFWYLGVLGTHPDHAGRGWGRAVMAAGLRRAQSERLPAVLETSNPLNVEIYHRCGWRNWREAKHGPLKIWIMICNGE